MVVFQKNDIRISLVLPGVLRVEKGAWTDMPTQIVQHRDHDIGAYTMTEEKGMVTVTSSDATFCIDTVSGKVCSIISADGTKVTDLIKGMLPGTARTLDAINGSVRLEKGITSRNGVSMLDDSKSLLLDVDGKILPRPACTDRYYFACGKDYQKQLNAFFALTGAVPLIPKFALGNWWSRYRA